jgi:hypothetical protein
MLRASIWRVNEIPQILAWRAIIGPSIDKT